MRTYGFTFANLSNLDSYRLNVSESHFSVSQSRFMKMLTIPLSRLIVIHILAGMLRDCKRQGLLYSMLFVYGLVQGQTLVDLPIGSAQTFGFNVKKLEQTLVRFERDVPSIGAVWIWKDNHIVTKKFYNNANASSTFDIKSASKSILSALVGILQ